MHFRSNANSLSGYFSPLRENPPNLGPILKIFSPKNLAKILAFFAQTAATFCKNLIVTFVF
jgi:hypothetical protein